MTKFKPDIEAYDEMKTMLKPILDDLNYAVVHSPEILDALSFATLYTIHDATYKREATTGKQRFQGAIMEAVVSFLLLKSGTEVGVAAVVAQLGLAKGRQWVDDILEGLKAREELPPWGGGGAGVR